MSNYTRTCKRCCSVFKIDYPTDEQIYCTHACWQKTRKKIHHRVCLQCGRNYIIDYPSNKSRHCSLKCAQIKLLRRHIIVCKVCKKEQSVKSIKKDNKYCGFDCYKKDVSEIAAKNPHRKIGYSTAFKKIREFIREECGYECQACGLKAKNLDVHHIDYNKNNNHPNNLIALCRPHHMMTNYNREEFRQMFQAFHGYTEEPNLVTRP